MKEPAATSPFAAMTSQEQKERWICWQSQKQLNETIITKPTVDDVRSESVLHTSKQTASWECEATHHGQYDAVIRRMKQAQQRTLTYTSCASGDGTRQP